MTAATVVANRATPCFADLLVEAAQVTVRSQRYWRNKFFHLALRRGRKIAKVAMARKLAVHLYWMWRQNLDYGQFEKLGSHAGEPDVNRRCRSEPLSEPNGDISTVSRFEVPDSL
jgi:hypothetical protein